MSAGLRKRSRGRPDSSKVFDRLAERYDAWFDQPEGKRIFEAELSCLRLVTDRLAGRWIEVGVGTGRFARALGVGAGIDAATRPLRLAMKRGIEAQAARAELLPYGDGCFDGVLMVTTISFLTDPAKVLWECWRVLKPEGRLLVGFLPADGPWGRLYVRKGREGHPFYSTARFYTCSRLVAMAAKTGLALQGAASCVVTRPNESVAGLSVREGIIPNAGFVALAFRKVQHPRVTPKGKGRRRRLFSPRRERRKETKP